MTLKEFLEKYVSPTNFISVFIRDDNGYLEDTVVYYNFAEDILAGKVGNEYLNREIVHICTGRADSLVIDIKGE